MRNTGFGYTHYTMSAWKSAQAMREFSRSGAHLDAIGKTQRLSHGVVLFTYEGDTLLRWRDAKQMVLRR
jgi:hypothetical protein